MTRNGSLWRSAPSGPTTEGIVADNVKKDGKRCHDAVAQITSLGIASLGLIRTSRRNVVTFSDCLIF